MAIRIRHIGDSISKLGVYESIGAWLASNHPSVSYSVDTINNGGVVANWAGNYFSWFDPYPADILICNAGMHDRDDPPADYASKLENVFRNYKALNPNIKVLWASTTLIEAPVDDPENVVILGNNIAAESILDSVFGSENWTLVDQQALQTAESIPFSDGIHPTVGGYVLYADNWKTNLAQVIEDYVEQPAVVVPKMAFGICPACPADFKTGVSTVSIIDGIATFSVDQTHDLMGVGAEITYNTTDKCYVKPDGKISTSAWRVTTKLGAIPANATDATVNRITHPFASIMLATNNFGSVDYLGTYDLRADLGANVELHLCCYKEQTSFTNDTTRVNYINKPKGDTTHRLYIRAPINTVDECNKSMGVDGFKYDSTKYNLTSTQLVFYKYTTSAWLYLKNLQITQNYAALAGTSRVINFVPVDIEQFDVDRCILITNTTGGSATAIQDIIFIGTVFNPKVNITNNIMIGLNSTGTNNGSALQLNCSATVDFRNNTVYGDFKQTVLNSVTGGVIVSRNNALLGARQLNSGIGPIDGDYDLYDLAVGETNGIQTTQTPSQLFKDASGVTYDLWDWEPIDGSDLIGNGVDGVNIGILSLFTVTYDQQGATTPSVPTTNDVTDGLTVVALPTDPVRTGYTFGGWWTAVSGGGAQFLANTVVSGDITVYAKWTVVTTVTLGASSTTANISYFYPVFGGGGQGHGYGRGGKKDK